VRARDLLLLPSQFPLQPWRQALAALSPSEHVPSGLTCSTYYVTSTSVLDSVILAKCNAVPSNGEGRRGEERELRVGCVRPGHRRRGGADPIHAVGGCGGHGQSAIPRGFPAGRHTPLKASVRPNRPLPRGSELAKHGEDWYWRRETPSHHSLRHSPRTSCQTPTAGRPCMESCELAQLAGCRILLVLAWRVDVQPQPQPQPLAAAFARLRPAPVVSAACCV